MTTRAHRSGRIAVLLLFSLAVMLGAFALAVNAALLAAYRVEMQAAADAAANAAAASLVHDDVLRGDLAAMPARIEQARGAAIDYAAANRVQGTTFALHPDHDIMFGILDTAFSDTLVLPGDVSDPNNTELLRINTVRIRALRSRQRGNAPGLFFALNGGVAVADIQAMSTVTLDRDVIGFRPFENRPIPLAPLALFSDPTAADTRSWDEQIHGGSAPDDFAFDRNANMFTAGNDGLREFPASLATDAGQVGTTNVAILSLGATDIADIVDQLLQGVSANHLAGLGGQLLLDSATNQLAVDGSENGPPVGSELNELYNALEQLRQSAQPRIWPLYCGTDGSDRPILCNFVAGRVVEVTPPTIGEPLRFTIQPTSVSEASAVTDAAQRGIGSALLPNPYIAKVRFVE